MTRHNSHRFSLMYQAILATSLSATALSAHAVNLSQANINSAQHEPLSATINVSDINADNFSANIGNASLYQQMGLNKDANIQVQFIPTSDTTGQLVLSSSIPISAPFTDVVLTLNNNGEQVIEPQTLLMPLPSSTSIAASATRPAVIANHHAQNLPIVSETVGETMVAANTVAGTPLAVQNTAPPPLFADDTTDSDTLVESSISATQETDTMPRFASSTPASTTTQTEVLAQATPAGSNIQLDILTQQLTRRVYPAGTAPTQTETPAILPEPAITAQGQAATEEQPTTQTAAQANTQTDTQPAESAVYVVQNGDNLWSIANELAKVNDLSLTEVMDTLHKQNPDAFNQGKANQLKTNATLNIPNYEIIPSQKAIQEAIQARQKTRASKSSTTTSAQKSNRNNAAVRTQSNRPKTTSHPLPTAQMTLVTPTQRGQATGTQTQRTTTAPASSNLSGDSAQLASTLQSTRQSTANSARRVNGLNQELSSATQRLQLQNQKLAELEARLKALRDK
ncbi:MAG: FimV/HubP family polar landmark protein [Moraxella sp.]|nr:FimV/HubP family polar landmark protein [Moraxella sp.]